MKKNIEYKITKTVLIEKEELIFDIKIRTKKFPGYEGFDLFPDDKIEGLLLAVGRMFSNNEKNKT